MATSLSQNWQLLTALVLMISAVAIPGTLLALAAEIEVEMPRFRLASPLMAVLAFSILIPVAAIAAAASIIALAGAAFIIGGILLGLAPLIIAIALLGLLARRH